jgi:DNA-binding NarL/FixJ family response regulator
MFTHSLHTNLASTPTPRASIVAGSNILYGRTLPTRPAQGRQRAPQESRQAGSRTDCAGRRPGEAAQPGTEPFGSILCVEDDQDIAGLLAEGLTELGYAVDIAPDGEVGLAKILANKPDLVLCDYSMPRMSGLELLQKLSTAGSQYATLPFILLTGSGDRDSELAARRLGVDDYLIKPVDLEMLGAVVENRLRRVDRRASSSTQYRLTEREKGVLAWVGRGKTSSEIAIILGVSERTVNFHCEQAMKRLDVINRTQAVTKAMAERLISI